MKVEFNALNENDLFDCCIIGTGPAGISCALELAKAGKKILLLEGGEDEVSEQSQKIYEGTVTGDEYFDLSVSRLRFFGGTSNHWAGWCRTLDDYDFENKGNFDTAWPISRKDIDPYLKKASTILEISDFPPDEPLGDSGINKISFKFSPPVNFLDKYYDTVSNHKHISLVLGANVTSIASDGTRVTGANIERFSGEKKRVIANFFVLATGGIENSRLLLWSNELSGGQVVKNPASLGRYWMDHPDYTIGSAIMENRVLGSSDHATSYFLAPTKETIIKNNILNCGLRISPNHYEGTKKLIGDLACVAPELGRGLLDLFDKKLICGYQIRASWEQEPVSTNRITLGPQKDRFGIPRVNLNWIKNKTDLRTVKQTTQIFGNYLARKNLGRVMLNPWLLDDDGFPDGDEIAGNHHMGGTRMAATSEKGVVDANCKVFGQENLYIAGSSVFTSCGYSNPTLSIVQIALRLANHLAKLI